MEKDEALENNTDATLPWMSTIDLRGKQSVRATFRLTEKAIDALSAVSTHLGIKQKSLFDHLMEDPRTLNLIAREIQSYHFIKLNRIQKTFVLSRRTLCSIEKVSKDYNAPRDALVEYSLLRLLPMIAGEKEKHEKRREILVEITRHLKQGQNILKKTGMLLGKEDPVFNKLETALAVYENARRNIETFVEKGKVIEDF